MVTKYAQPWSIQESDCPGEDDPSARLKFLIGYAILAPSSWNSQPWRFRVTDKLIEVFDNPKRGQEQRDHDGRERLTSCGAAIGNLQVALRQFGLKNTLTVMPDPDNANLLARFTIEAATETEKEAQLFKAITARHSFRKSFSERPVDEEIITGMQAAAQDQTACFIPITNKSVQIALSGMVAEGDRDLGSNEATRKEYASWVRRSDRQGDGVPGYALGLSPVESMLAPVTRRVFNYSDENAHKDRELTSECPLLGVIATPQDTPADWVRGGMLTQRVLLVAAANNVLAQFINQPIPIPELRERLRTLIGTENWPQTVLRFGYTDAPVKPTPRLPLEDVLIP